MEETLIFFNPAPDSLDELDTETSSACFGDWENEKDSDTEVDPNNDEKCIISKNSYFCLYSKC